MKIEDLKSAVIQIKAKHKLVECILKDLREEQKAKRVVLRGLVAEFRLLYDLGSDWSYMVNQWSSCVDDANDEVEELSWKVSGCERELDFIEEAVEDATNLLLDEIVK